MRIPFYVLVGGILSLFGGANASSAADFGSSYKLVAFSGQSAPGGGSFYYFTAPRIGANGDIGFIGTSYRGESSTSTIYRGRPGALKRLVATGDTVPDGKGEFADFSTLSVSKDGGVGFNAGVSYDGYSQGIYAASPGGSISPVGPSSGLNLISRGAVTFRSGTIFAKGVFYESEGVQEDEYPQALFRGTGGALSPSLVSGTVLDGRRVQKIYGDDEGESSIGSSVDSNESGQIALKVSVAPTASATPNPVEAIYAGNPGTPNLVAKRDGGAPGISGAYYSHLSPRPSIAANGQVAFSAVFSSEAGSRSGIFAGTPGSLAPKVLENSLVPTTTDVRFGTLSDAVVNSSGDVIFRATIVYPDESTRQGIWIQRKTGSPVLIAISGMNLPTPSGSREVTSVDFAGPGTFNDLHQFVFLAHFGDDQGIYVADTRPVAPWLRAIFPRKPRDRVTRAKSINISGTASDDTGIARVEYSVEPVFSANKKSRSRANSVVRKAKGDKRWKFKVPLARGVNRITVKATDKLGNVSEPLVLMILRY